MVTASGCWRSDLARRLEEAEMRKEASERHVERYRAAAVAKDAYIKSITLKLNQITDQIELMRTEELALMEVALTREAKGQTFSAGDRVPETLAKLRRLLDENRIEIDTLQSVLETADASLIGLVTMAQRLRVENEALERRIDKLRERVVSLSGRIVELEDEMETLAEESARKDAVIADQQDEAERERRRLAEAQHALRRVYFVLGTLRDLKRAGVMRGRKRLAAHAFDDLSSFQQADRTSLRSIELGRGAARSRLFPPRPPSSFRIVEVRGFSKLLIVDPQTFWKVPYLVIVRRS